MSNFAYYLDGSYFKQRGKVGMKIICFNGIHSLINNRNTSSVCTSFKEKTVDYQITEIWNNDIRDEIDFKDHFLYPIIVGLHKLRTADLHAHIALSVSDDNKMILCHENCYIEVFKGQSCVWNSGRKPKGELSILRPIKKYTKENRPELPKKQKDSEFWADFFAVKIHEAIKDHIGGDELREHLPHFTPYF